LLTKKGEESRWKRQTLGKLGVQNTKVADGLATHNGSGKRRGEGGKRVVCKLSLTRTGGGGVNVGKGGKRLLRYSIGKGGKEKEKRKADYEREKKTLCRTAKDQFVGQKMVGKGEGSTKPGDSHIQINERRGKAGYLDN